MEDKAKISAAQFVWTELIAPSRLPVSDAAPFLFMNSTVTIGDLCARIEFSVEEFGKFIIGETPITKELAEKLSTLFGGHKKISPEFLLNMEHEHDDYIAGLHLEQDARNEVSEENSGTRLAERQEKEGAGDMHMHHSLAVHVGQFVDEVHIQEGYLSELDLCEHMGWGMNQFDDFIAGKITVTEEMAEKLSELLAGSAKFWMNMQGSYDAAQARKEVESGTL